MSAKVSNSPIGLQNSAWEKIAIGLTASVAIFSMRATIGKAVGPTFSDSFESGNLSSWKKEICCNHSAEVVSSPARTGSKAVKFTLKKEDPITAGSKRAELKLGTVPANSEQWYAFSVFFPADFVPDPDMEIIAQWHNVPDFNQGETWRTPALYLRPKNGKLYIQRRWDARPVNGNNPQGRETIDLGFYKTNAWTDFVFHVKWSHKGDGLLEVWQDGKLIVQKQGPNVYNDAKGPYFKFGIYKPGWKNKPEQSRTNQRTLFFDDIRTGDTAISYREGSSSGSIAGSR